MNSPSTDSQLVRERLMPQFSIRFFIFLIGVSAVVMYTLRAAVVTNHSWAKIVSLMMATTIGCFLAYAFLFLVANLFNVTTMPIRDAIAAAQGDATWQDERSPQDDPSPRDGLSGGGTIHQDGDS